MCLRGSQAWNADNLLPQLLLLECLCVLAQICWETDWAAGCQRLLPVGRGRAAAAWQAGHPRCQCLISPAHIETSLVRNGVRALHICLAIIMFAWMLKQPLYHLQCLVVLLLHCLQQDL